MLARVVPVSYTHLDVYKRQPLKNVAYKGSLALDVYPATGGNANAPVLLFLHSGGWFKGDKTDDAARFGESLSAQGITVVAPNYTLCLLYTSRCV